MLIIKYKNYKKVADYAKWYFQVYKEKESDCTSLGVSDFKNTVVAIHLDVDVAYKALNIKNTEHEPKWMLLK